MFMTCFANNIIVLQKIVRDTLKSFMQFGTTLKTINHTAIACNNPCIKCNCPQHTLNIFREFLSMLLKAGLTLNSIQLFQKCFYIEKEHLSSHFIRFELTGTLNSSNLCVSGTQCNATWIALFSQTTCQFPCMFFFLPQPVGKSYKQSRSWMKENRYYKAIMILPQISLKSYRVQHNLMKFL